MVAGALRTRARVLRRFSANTRKNFITEHPQRSWPKGYQLDKLGPPPLLRPDEREAGG